MATRIDGKALAAKVKAQVAEKAAKLPRQPGLAVVLVGEDPASQVYVRGKEADCGECGIRSFPYRLPTETTQRELLDLIEKLNRDPAVDGILVQLPLPKHINEERILSAISIEKDVDGFHPRNIGKLAMKVAFRLVNPREASQTSIMLAISAASVWLMCPCMSFFATLLFKDSHNAQFFAIWVQTTVMNFPMALLWQFFAAGPLVRRIFGLLFRENADKSSATEMESV